jgi:hypothetical protein
MSDLLSRALAKRDALAAELNRVNQIIATLRKMEVELGGTSVMAAMDGGKTGPQAAGRVNRRPPSEGTQSSFIRNTVHRLLDKHGEIRIADVVNALKEQGIGLNWSSANSYVGNTMKRMAQVEGWQNDPGRRLWYRTTTPTIPATDPAESNSGEPPPVTG